MRFAIMKGAAQQEKMKTNYLETQLSLARKRPLQDDQPPVLKKPKIEIIELDTCK